MIGSLQVEARGLSQGDDDAKAWRENRVSYCLSITPLSFAQLAIAVSIHLDVRAIAQEKLRFGAGGHLRAMGSTVAMESGGCRIAGWCFVYCLWRYAMGTPNENAHE